MVRKTTWLACAGWLAIAVQGAATASEDRIAASSVEELVGAVTAQLTSIESLLCEYTIQYGNQVPPVQCRYACLGRKWHYAELSTVKEGHKENTYCFDGDLVFAFVVTHKQEGPDAWSTVQIQDPRPQGNMDPEFLLGRRLSNVCLSVVDVIKLGTVAKSQASLPDGTLEPGLLVRDVPAACAGSADLKYDVAVRLDPKHGLLPAEILITESQKNVTWRGWEQRWKTLEFRRVRDEQSGRESWFPVSGVLTQGATDAPAIKMIVDKVQINPALPPALFRPDVPDGTQVADTTSDGRGRVFITGGHVALDRRMQLLTDSSESALRWGTGRLLFVAFGVLAVALLLAFFVLRRRRRCQSL